MEKSKFRVASGEYLEVVIMRPLDHACDCLRSLNCESQFKDKAHFSFSKLDTHTIPKQMD